MMKLRRLYLIAALVGTLAVISCGSDSGSGNGGNGDLCNFGACATNEGFKQVCLDEYNDCLGLGTQTEAECKLLAEETCGA